MVTTRAKLSLVDLAGSEKGAGSTVGSTQERERSRINSSLSALSNCISCLGDARRTHVPFRDNPLTRWAVEIDWIIFFILLGLTYGDQIIDDLRCYQASSVSVQQYGYSSTMLRASAVAPYNVVQTRPLSLIPFTLVVSPTL